MCVYPTVNSPVGKILTPKKTRCTVDKIKKFGYKNALYELAGDLENLHWDDRTPIGQQVNNVLDLIIKKLMSGEFSDGISPEKYRAE